MTKLTNNLSIKQTIMAILNDNPGQGHRGGQENGDDNKHKSQRNQDNQKPNTKSDEEKVKQHEDEDNFSPGEDDDYDAEDYVTD